MPSDPKLYGEESFTDQAHWEAYAAAMHAYNTRDVELTAALLTQFPDAYAFPAPGDVFFAALGFALSAAWEALKDRFYAFREALRNSGFLKQTDRNG